MRTAILSTVILLLLGGQVWSQAKLAPATLAPPVVESNPGPPPMPLPAPDSGFGSAPRQLSRPVDNPPFAPPQFSPPDNSLFSVPEGGGPLGRSWGRVEYLLWWIKDSRIPPLITSSLRPSPRLDSPDTIVLVGDHIGNQDRSGARFTFGVALDPDQVIGVEGSYFVLATRTTTLSAGSTGLPDSAAIGLPFFDPFTLTEQAQGVASPRFASGVADVSASTRMQGAEVNGLFNLLSGPGYQLDALAGFRYLELDEGLQIAYVSNRPQVGGVLVLGAADQFDGHNRFYGGQVGLRGHFSRGPLFLDVAGKLALGETVEVVRISGLSRRSDPGTGETVQPGGTFALATNSGRFARGAFAVAPELSLRLGVELFGRARVFVGYNFLYLSEVARPGDQMNRNVNLSQMPLSTRGDFFFGPPLPNFAFHGADFWAQGLLFGVEYRY